MTGANNIRPGTLLRTKVLGPRIRDLPFGGAIVIDVGGRDGALARTLTAEGAKTVCVMDREFGGGEPSTESVSYTTADVTELPLRSGSVDLVLCLDVIEHVFDDRRVIAEIARSLKSRGLVVLTTPKSTFRLPPFTRAYVNRKWGHVRNGYTEQNLTRLLVENGFRVLVANGYHNLITRVAYALLFMTGVSRLAPKASITLFAKLCSLDNIRLLYGEHFMVGVKENFR